MKKFLDENFLLQTKTAQILYHEFAKDMPVIDYHNHLPPDQIAGDINFKKCKTMGEVLALALDFVKRNYEDVSMKQIIENRINF